jgi:predicted PurR-regulated permease PerM
MFSLMLLAACYAAAEIIPPIVLAFVLMLVLQPAMRLLERLYLPRGLAALVIILIQFAAFAGLGTFLLGPATSWAQKLPDGIPKPQERLDFLSQPIASFQKFVNGAQDLAPVGEAKPRSVKVQGTGLSEQLLNGTRSVVTVCSKSCSCCFFC